MPKSLKIKVGNKAKSRQNSKHKASGYYSKQFARTEANRKRKRLNHFHRHPNSIKGFEELRKSLGI